MAPVIHVNGRYVGRDEASVSVFDHGLLYGDGVFEGIRAYAGRVFALEDHVRRLFTSARAICLAPPLSPDGMAEAILETCRRNQITDGYVRLVLTRGKGDLGIDPRKCHAGPTLIIIAEPSISVVAERDRPGLRLVTSSLRRVAPDALSPSIKSLNYLNNILAKIEANQRGADEAVMLDAQGYVAEATVDNLFIVRAGVLMTPWTSTNLEGITRATIVRLAREDGINVIERPFALFDVWAADEAFVSGTAVEIQPVESVDGRTIGTMTPGPLTIRLAERYHAFVRTNGTPIEIGATAAARVPEATVAQD